MKAARSHAGLSQQGLGDKVGRTKANVGHWETNKHSPSFNMLQLIAEKTNYPMPSEWSGSAPVQAREGDPGDMRPMPTIGETILHLSRLLATFNAMGRASVMPLIIGALEHPEQAEDAAHAADALAQTQRLKVTDLAASQSFGKAHVNPVETGLSPLETKK